MSTSTKSMDDLASVSIADVMEAVGANPGYQFHFRAIDIPNITGPHANDRGAMHFPVTVTPELCNSFGTLHGGNASWLIDTLSGCHVAVTHDTFDQASVTLSLSFLRACPGGTKVLVKTYVRKAGRQLVFLEGAIVNAADPSIIYVTAVHNCAVVKARL